MGGLIVEKRAVRITPPLGPVDPCDNAEDRFCSEAGRTVGKGQSKGEGEGLGEEGPRRHCRGTVNRVC